MNLNDLKKYFKKPLLVAISIFVIGFILAILTVGAGGASVIFIVLGWYGALIAMFIYWLLLAFKSGNKSEMVVIPSLVIILGLISGNGTLYNKQCAITTDFAVERVKKHLINTKQPLSFLGTPQFRKERCEVWIDYVGNGDDITYIVSEYGKLHMDVRKGSAMK